MASNEAQKSDVGVKWKDEPHVIEVPQLMRTSSKKIFTHRTLTTPTKTLRTKSFLWLRSNVIVQNSDNDQYCNRKIMAMALMSGALFIVGTTAASVHYLEAQPNNKIEETRTSWPLILYYVAFGIGSLCGGILSYLSGRIRALSVFSLTNPVGWLLIAFSPSTTVQSFGLLWCSLSCGGLLSTLQVYICEISSKISRSWLGALGVSSAVFGYHLQYLLSEMESSSSLLCGLVLSVVSSTVVLTASFFLPESPIWLILSSRESDAVQALTSLKTDDSDSMSEFLLIKTSIHMERSCPTLWKAFKRAMVLCMFIHGLVTLDAIPMVNNPGEMITGPYSLAGALMFIPLMKYMSRVKLLLFCLAATALRLVLVSISKTFELSDDGQSFSLMFFCQAAGYVISTIGLISMPLIYSTEFHSSLYRDILHGLTITITSISLAVWHSIMGEHLISDLFLSWFAIGLCLFLGFFVSIYLHETQGKHLAELEQSSTGRKVMATHYKTSRESSTVDLPYPHRSLQFTL